MELIDLLIKIANGEKPKRFKLFIGNNVFEYELSDNGNYYEKETEEEFTESINLTFCLNSKVEIIKDEEEKKVPEKLTIKRLANSNQSIQDDIIETINQLIDYLKSKGE